jgi:hypothetical protein
MFNGLRAGGLHILRFGVRHTWTYEVLWIVDLQSGCCKGQREFVFWPPPLGSYATHSLGNAFPVGV